MYERNMSVSTALRWWEGVEKSVLRRRNHAVIGIEHLLLPSARPASRLHHHSLWSYTSPPLKALSVAGSQAALRYVMLSLQPRTQAEGLCLLAWQVTFSNP